MIRRVLESFGIRFISRQTALSIARRKCDEEGWPWQEPVLVREGIFTTSIWTNCEMKGGNVGIRVRARDGSIVSAGFIRR